MSQAMLWDLTQVTHVSSALILKWTALSYRESSDVLPEAPPVVHYVQLEPQAVRELV